jgi:lipopolysaccharide transport system permease protein
MSKKVSQFTTIIEANSHPKEYFKDLFRYRELFYFFAWRDILIRYKQTLLGVIWVLVRPLINMLVFAFVFGYIAHLPSGPIDYHLFILAGMLPWQLFAACLVDTSNCLLANSLMLSKVYFPRIILPISYILVNTVDFFISLTFILLLFAVLKVISYGTLLVLPLLIVLSFSLCLGAGLWLAALTVCYRDVRFLMPFIVQFGMFISPVGYSGFLVPESWRWIYFLNPMAGIIEGFRWCFFGVYQPDLPIALIISVCITGALLVTGFSFFRKMERVFADII